MNPDRPSNSLRINSLCRLTKSCEKRYPYLTSLSTSEYVLNSFSTCMHAGYDLYGFWIILISFKNVSRLFNNSSRPLWHTLSKAFASSIKHRYTTACFCIVLSFVTYWIIFLISYFLFKYFFQLNPTKINAKFSIFK